MNSKICSTCKKSKLVSEFYKRKDRPLGYTSLCKLCIKKGKKQSNQKHRKKRLAYSRKYAQEHKELAKIHAKKYRYRGSKGLAKQLQTTSKELTKTYDKLFDIQKGRCAICGKHESELGMRLCIDHNHETKEIRALLCRPCNLGIGNFNEDVNLLQCAIRYLDGQALTI